MFDNLSRLFRKTEVGHINLLFEMDLNSKGQHIVRINRECENGLEQIQDIDKLLAYDYHEET